MWCRPPEPICWAPDVGGGRAYSGGGAYSCSLPGPGTYNLYATKVPEYGPFGSQISATCDASPMSYDVTLNFENGGL